MKMRTVYTTFGLLLLGALLMSNENGRAFSQNKGNTGAPATRYQVAPRVPAKAVTAQEHLAQVLPSSCLMMPRR